MTLPDAATLTRVIEATWPAASVQEVEGWIIRDGQGGGSRVSAATQITPDADIGAAEDAIRALSQIPLFMMREGDDVLDQALAQRGYTIKDPVVMLAAPLDVLTVQRPPPRATFEVWPPLAAQREIWAEGGIGAGRLAVMERASCPKTTILGRVGDHPAGAAYVGISEGCAMIHALEVHTDFRRNGLARHMTVAAALWAQALGAHTMTLVTTQANVASKSLYASLGMTVVGHYHYRVHG